MKKSRPHRGATRGDLLLLLALAALLVVEAAAWRLGHRSEDDLRSALELGRPRQQVEALHILAQRGRPRGIDQRLVRDVLASDRVLLREFSMTGSLTRIAGRRAQRDYLRSPAIDPAERTRCRFFLRLHDRRLRLRDLERYFASLENHPTARRPARAME